MKSKVITQLVLLSLLCLIAIPMVQAAPPQTDEKMISIEHTYEEYDGVYIVGIEKITAIVKSVEENEYDVSLLGLFTNRLYLEDELVIVLKLTIRYTGIMKGSVFGGQMWTGKLTWDYNINILTDADITGFPLPTEDGHWVIWYENGSELVDKTRGHGTTVFFPEE